MLAYSRIRVCERDWGESREREVARRSALSFVVTGSASDDCDDLCASLCGGGLDMNEDTTQVADWTERLMLVSVVRGCLVCSD